MSLDEFVFHIEKGACKTTFYTKFIFILFDVDHIEIFKIVRETEKAFCLKMISKSLYRGAIQFWVPKAALSAHTDLSNEVVQLKHWFISKLLEQDKINLGIIA